MTPDARAVALRLAHVRVNVDKVDLAALDAPLTRPQVAAAPAPTTFAEIAEGFAQLPAASFDFRSTAAAA
jgi:hypothetical protein